MRQREDSLDEMGDAVYADAGASECEAARDALVPEKDWGQ